MSSAAPLVKAALFSACTTLFAGTAQVIYGPRGPITADDLISIGNVTTEVAVQTIAPTRPRNEEHDVEVIFSCSRSGPETAQQTATERAYTLVATLDTYLATSPNETLGIVGAQQTWARIVSLSLDEPLRQATGRTADVTVIVRVRTRI